MERLIFHVVNSAFLSWEATRRFANGEEDIRLIPSAIGGDRARRTGVLLAKFIPAKKLGIKPGEPIGMALRKRPDLFLARPDFQLYEETSKAFMDICIEYTPIVEKYSVGECFLDITCSGILLPDSIKAAYQRILLTICPCESRNDFFNLGWRKNGKYKSDSDYPYLIRGDRMKNASAYYVLEKIDGKHDVKKIKQTLGTLPGVTSVSVNAPTNQIAVDFDTTGVQSSRIEKQLKKVGYTICETNMDNHTM